MPYRMTAQTLRRLSYFSVIAEAGSIREASRRLGLSPAAVSESLKAFEEELGTTLATRNTRRLELTGEGRRVEEIATRMLNVADDLFAAKQGALEIVGHVGLTAPVELAHSWLPPRLKRFRAAFPGVQLSLSASDQVADLKQSPFDIALRAKFILDRRDVGDAPTQDLVCVSTFPLQVERRDGHWFAAGTLINAQPIAELCVFNAESQTIEKLFFQDVLVVDDKIVALALVEQGIGSALVTTDSVTPNLFKLGAGLPLDFGVIRLDALFRDKRPSRAARALFEALDG